MILTVLTAAGLLVGTVLLWRLPQLGPAATRARSVSVIVPARNEAANLPTLLGSLSADAQSWAGVVPEVIVVDDGSTDGTADVAAAHGARVIATGPLPADWLGKPWACQRGAEAASGSVLLFVDADVEFAPGTLARLVGELDRCGGLVSVQPRHDTVRWYEQLSAYFNVVALMGVGAFTPARTVDPAGAFGPCLVTSAADHRALGGHTSVRDRVLDDVYLARRYRAAGLPVTCRVGAGAVGFRMYPEGPRQLVEGWSKNIALGAVATKPWAAAGAALWVAATAAIAVTTLLGVGRWVFGAAGPPWLALLGWALVAGQLTWMLRRIGRFRVWTAALFVVPLAGFIAIFVRSAVLTIVRRQVRWRGRAIPIASDSSGAAPT